MQLDEVYRLLSRAGHSPQKALEIAVDYTRGDALARAWVDGFKVKQDVLDAAYAFKKTPAQSA